MTIPIEPNPTGSPSLVGQWLLVAFLAVAALIIGGVTAALVCLAVFLLVRYQIGSESPEKHGIAHFPSSRLGGVLVLGYLVGSVFWFHKVEHLPLVQPELIIAAIACLGVFAVGLVEDVTGLLPAKIRLLTLAAIVVPLIWLDPSLPMQHSGLSWLDALLSIQVLAYAFSLFGILFLINAANAADGANGLLSGTALVALWVLVQVSQLWVLAPLSTGLMVFFLINLSTGKLFLGDSGAYFIGIVLAVALIQVANQQVVSSWLLLSLVFYPTADFLVSLARRMCWGGSLMAADNFHFHNMLHVELCRAGWSPLLSNSLTGLAVVVIWSLPTLVFFELNVPVVTWAWVYGLYWLVFLALWTVFYRRQMAANRKPRTP